MKNIILPLAFFCTISIYSQFSISDGINTGNQISKQTKSTNFALQRQWIQTAEIGLILPTETEYSYSRSVNNGFVGSSEDFSNKLSFDALYTINYPLFKKFTIGAIGGFQYQTQQSITALKIGGMFRYYFKDYENANMYLLLAKNLAINDKINSAMANLRLGIGFPIKKTDALNLTLNIFWDYNFYDIKTPILEEVNELPGSLTARGYGVSFGFQF